MAKAHIDVPSEAGTHRPHAWSVLLQRNFGLFFVGSFLSNIGTFFQVIAQALLMYQLTHSSLAVGVVGFASSISSLLLSPWAGTLADRVDRRRLLMSTQLLALVVAAAQAGLTFAGLINVPWLLSAALLMGLANAFATPVQYSFLPELVGPEQLQASLQMNSVTFNIGRVIGPVLGVLTVNQFGYGWAFMVNAISFVALIVALLLIIPRPVARSERRLVVTDLFRLATGNRRIALLLLTVVAVVMTYDPIQTLAPALVEQVFKAPSTWVGGLLGALGVGAIIGTLLPGRQPTMHRVAGLLGLFGVGMLFYALAPSPQLALAGPLVAGIGYLLSNTGSQGLLFLEAGEGQAGQVMALYSMAFVGVRPIISLLDGGLADVLGVRQAGVIMTLPALSIAVVAGITLLLKRRSGQLAVEG